MIAIKFTSNTKPLSAFRYFLSNKRRSFSMALAMAVSVLLLMVFQTIFYSVIESGRMANSGPLNHMTLVSRGDSGIINPNVLSKIKESPDLERIVPILLSNTDYFHFFGNFSLPIYHVSNNNLNYVLDHLGLELVEGRLPEQDKNEVVLDERTLKNKDKRLGDYIGRQVDPNERLLGKYKIVGVLKGESLTGITVTAEATILKNSSRSLLFAKAGRLDYLNKLISGTNSEDARFKTKEDGKKDYEEDIESMDMVSTIIAAVVIFIMSFAAGNSSYAQYFSRKYEFATLLSIGYSRLNILLRAGWEILVTYIVGLILGINLVLIAKLGLKVLIFDPNGYPFILFQLQGLSTAFIIPLCTVIFSLIPAWWTLSRVDQVEIIEKYE